METAQVELVILACTIIGQLVSTVWWASSLTARVKFLEGWIREHAQIASDIAVLKQQAEVTGSDVKAIRHHLLNEAGMS